MADPCNERGGGCANGGICSSGGYAPVCDCGKCFTGARCEMRKSDPCQRPPYNSGTFCGTGTCAFDTASCRAYCHCSEHYCGPYCSHKC